jgi:hypothetical protein
MQIMTLRIAPNSVGRRLSLSVARMQDAGRLILPGAPERSFVSISFPATEPMDPIAAHRLHQTVCSTGTIPSFDLKFLKVLEDFASGFFFRTIFNRGENKRTGCLGFGIQIFFFELVFHGRTHCPSVVLVWAIRTFLITIGYMSHGRRRMRKDARCTV